MQISWSLLEPPISTYTVSDFELYMLVSPSHSACPWISIKQAHHLRLWQCPKISLSGGRLVCYGYDQTSISQPPLPLFRMICGIGLDSWNSWSQTIRIIRWQATRELRGRELISSRQPNLGGGASSTRTSTVIIDIGSRRVGEGYRQPTKILF